MRVRLLCLLGALCIGCDRPSPEPPPIETTTAAAFAFDSARVRIETATDTHVVRVEVAEREDQRAFGLMERTSLDEDAGMVFIYTNPQPGSSGFWMYRTRIPLDIAFFDSAGRIVAIRQMDPCPSPDPAVCQQMARGYSPGETYFGALEVNRGYFSQRGIRAGDRIVVLRD